MVLSDYTGLNNEGLQIKVEEYFPVYSLPSKSKVISKCNEFNLMYVVKNNCGELYGKIQLVSGLYGYIMLNDLGFEYEDPTLTTKIIIEDEKPKKYNVNNSIYMTKEKSDSYVVSQFYDKDYKFSLYLTHSDIIQDNNYYNSLIDEKNKIEFKPYGNAINAYTTLADTASIWYQSKFNISSYGECPWYAFGRVGEIYGCYLKFNGSANGGFWIENTLGVAYEYDMDKEEINKDNINNVVIERNPYNVKRNSVVSFLYGDYGHVMFVEAVQRDEKTGEPLNVIFSDSWNVYGSDGNVSSNRNFIGALIEISFDNFILLYSTQSANAKNTNHFSLNPNFSGYIQFQ